jgi:ribose 5-phosphate isomerase B
LCVEADVATIVAYASDKANPTMDSERIVTAEDLVRCEPNAEVRLRPGTRLTPLAEDVVRERGLRISYTAAGVENPVVAVAADHGGFRLKEEVKALLTELGLHPLDLGTDSEEPVDYPDFAHAAARAVADGRASLAVVVDGAGMGSAITANKVPGIRAAACYTPAQARNAREHNGTNVLTLGSRMVTSDEMREIVRTWLASEIGEDRHRARVAKIVAFERRYLR